MKKKFLVLENGKIFEGKGFGFDGDTVGEIVFTTGVGGYTEILTDPSFYGQIVMHTFPLVGNFGLAKEDFESSKPQLKGYVVREYCDTPSNFRCEMTLDEFLKQYEIPGIYGIDTRELTEIIRENGCMNAAVVNEVTDEVLSAVKNYRISDAVKTVSDNTVKEYPAQGKEKYRVALLNYGVTESLIATLTKRGCHVTCLPYNTTAEEVFKLSPDGIMLSNGPGDPKDNSLCIEQIKKLIGKKPIFGVGMGHELMALALGGDTFKMPHGHRGGNPVKNVETGRVFITSQSHGYAVDIEKLPKDAVVTHVNVNDNTCEGMDYPSLKAFTLQFPPEACPGPTEAMKMTDKFCKMMEDEKVCR